MQKMTPIERLGLGLAVMGIGIALFMGLPPPWWSDMSPRLVHFGVSLGVILIFVGAFLVLTAARDRHHLYFGGFKRRLRRMWPQYLMLVCGIGFFIGLVGFLQINVDRPADIPLLKETVTSHATEIVAALNNETERLVSQAQFAKVAELEGFLGGKDENGLRQIFDIPNVLQKNINAQIVRIGFIKSGREKQFIYTDYSDNGSMIFWAKEGHFSTGPSGVHVDAGPKDVLFLVTTSKFQNAQAKIIGFLNSALIPDSIKEPLKAFDGVVNKIPELMMNILDERMHEDENFFIFNMQMGTPFYGVIVSEFATKTPHLKPAADLVLTAVAASWKISR
jgi:hypothetical protein